MTVRERVKMLCDAHDISVNKFEQEMGFSKGYVSKLDNSTPNSKYVKAMADYFKVSVDFILNGDPVEDLGENDYSEREKRLVEYFRRLSEENKGYVIGYMVGALQSENNNDHG